MLTPTQTDNHTLFNIHNDTRGFRFRGPGDAHTLSWGKQHIPLSHCDDGRVLLNYGTFVYHLLYHKLLNARFMSVAQGRASPDWTRWQAGNLSRSHRAAAAAFGLVFCLQRRQVRRRRVDGADGRGDKQPVYLEQLCYLMELVAAGATVQGKERRKNQITSLTLG